MFRTPTERDRAAPGGRPGLAVWARDGRRWFFPGATVELARALADGRLPPGVWDDPHTRAEFGTADGRSFTAEKVLKSPPPVPPGAVPDRGPELLRK